MRDSFEGLAQRLLGGTVKMEEAVELLERSMIEGALKLKRNNQSAAAKLLGVHRNTLLRKMIEYELPNGRTRRKPVVRATRARKRATKAA
jgi:DNA-binding NtrC family response regulator